MKAQTFAELGASDATISALSKRGIQAPFEVQALVIPDALAGRDILAKSRTGSGKTLAFALPLVEMIDGSKPKPAALVLVPTRELASQVTEEVSSIAGVHGLKVCAVYGGVGLQDQARLAARSHIIVATPGRLEDLVARRLLRLDDVSILILDEADRMLDMGFQPQVDRIVRMIPTDRQTMFFSATLDGEVGRIAKAYTRSAILHEVASPKSTVEEVSHDFVQVSANDKVATLVKLLQDADGLALVFVRTKRGADRLAVRLRSNGIRAAVMHGDMTQSARERSLKQFEKGTVTTMIATDVAARGLDLDEISHVINFDPPEDHTAYVHRIGRTARAGRSGAGITFVTAEQQADVGRVAARLELTDEFEKNGMKTPGPSVVFSSHRGRSMMRKPRPRRI